MKKLFGLLLLVFISANAFTQELELVATSKNYNPNILCYAYENVVYCNMCGWSGWSHWHYYNKIYYVHPQPRPVVYHHLPYNYYHKSKPAPSHQGTHNIAPRPKETIRKPVSTNSHERKTSSTRTTQSRSTTNTRK